MVFETVLVSDLQKMVNVKQLSGNLFSADNGGNKITVEILDGGAPATVSGSVYGYAIREDEKTVVIEGTLSGNKASIVLPASAYAVIGKLNIVIKVGTATVGACSAYVYRTTTDAIVDPGSVVPDISELLAQIGACEEATTAANTAATAANTAAANVGGNLAANYSTSAAYAVGDYCIKDGTLYRCTTAITSGENWNSAHWTAAKIGPDVSALKSALNAISSIGSYLDLSQVEMTMGSYLKENGSIGESEPFMLSGYIEVADNVESVTVNRVIYAANGTAYPQSHMVWWYDSEKNLLNLGSSEVLSDNLLTSVRPSSGKGKYIRVNFSRYYVNNFVLCNKMPDVTSYTIPLQLTDIRDLNDLEYNRIYALTSSPSLFSHLPYADFYGTIFTYSYKGNFVSTCGQMAVSDTNRLFTRRTWGVNADWSDWVEYPNEAAVLAKINSAEGYVGSYTGTFTIAGNKWIVTNLRMEANKTYRIVFTQKPAARIYIGGVDNPNDYRYVMPWENEALFTNDGTPRYLRLYDLDTTLATVSVEMYEADSFVSKANNGPRVYKVAKTGIQANYTSLTQCLFDLKDDHSPKIIEIWEGDYDIYAEYKALWNAGLLNKYTGTSPATEYFDYCVWVPENTRIIGKGIVRLKWMPTATQLASDGTTSYQTRCISPLNVAATATIENVEVYCKNGRYCLHNDGLGKAEFIGAVQKYVNVKFFKYENERDETLQQSYGFAATIGFGIDRSQNHFYENCTFVNYLASSAFYGHSRVLTMTSQAESPNITLINCVMESYKILECTTAIVTPEAWNSEHWTNAIPDDTVTDAQIESMKSSARINYSSSATYEVGDYIIVYASETIKFGNSEMNTPNARIRTVFNNCWLRSKINSRRETDPASCANAFDMQFLNCGNVSVNIADANNPYPPKGYGTTLTVTVS